MSSIPRGGNRPPPAPANNRNPVNPNRPSVQVANANQDSSATRAEAAKTRLLQGGSKNFTTKQLKDTIELAERLSGFFSMNNDKSLFSNEFEKGKSALKSALKEYREGKEGGLKALIDKDPTGRKVLGTPPPKNSREYGAYYAKAHEYYERLAKTADFVSKNFRDIAGTHKDANLISWDDVYKMQQRNLLATSPLPPVRSKGKTYEYDMLMVSPNGQTNLIYKCPVTQDFIIIDEETGQPSRNPGLPRF